MKVLLVGSTGYLGSVLATKFLASGHEVHASVRNDASFEAARSIGLKPFKGDLANSETIYSKFDSVDAIVVSAIVPFQEEEAYLRPAAGAPARHRQGVHFYLGHRRTLFAIAKWRMA